MTKIKLKDYQQNPETGSIRDGIGQGVLALGQKNQDVVALSADLTESVRLHWFQEQYPKRFVQVGVAEQNLIGLAAGLALAGKKPFAGSYAVFSPGRSWDQLRVSVCYSNLPVTIIGGHAGLTVGPDGATHQALEDIAITRVLPNMTVIVPCDQHQAFQAVQAIGDHAGPVYLRSSRIKNSLLTEKDTPFEIGQAQIFRSGQDVTLAATGLMVESASQAADSLAKEGIQAEVINVHTIKPLDRDTLIKSAAKTGAMVTAEEHQLAGGLGSAVAELLSQEQPTAQKMVGVANTFGESGSAEALLTKYHLTPADIATAAKAAIRQRDARSHQGKHAPTL